MDKPTQQEIDDSFNEVKEEWDKLVKDSGLSESVFIATDKYAIQFLAEYQEGKEAVQAIGLTMPDLVKGMTIKLS